MINGRRVKAKGKNEKPYVLFKFRKINIIENNIPLIDQRLIDAIEHSEIYFAKPEELNDPFDCQVDIINALKNACLRPKLKNRSKIEQLLNNQNKFLTAIQEHIRTYGICSFSCKDNEIILYDSLMWVHYADLHHGLCLTYSFPESFFITNSIAISPVDYNVNALTDWFIEYMNTHSQLDPIDLNENLIKKMLTIKDKSWEYEKEVRIINDKAGTFSIDKQYLKQVCFGLKTKESDVEFVTELLRKHDYNVARCRIIRDPKHDFGIIAQEI